MNPIETTHLIAQYLAAAGISFLEKNQTIAIPIWALTPKKCAWKRIL